MNLSFGQRLALWTTITAASCFPTATANAISVMIAANIDGRSQLVLTPTQVSWRHYEGAAPGTHNGCGCATYIYAWDNGVFLMPQIIWYPTWPTSWSDPYTFNTPLPRPTGQVSILWAQYRDPVTIVQQPSATNGYETIVEFNDGEYSDYWYNVVLFYGSCTYVSQDPVSASACVGESHALVANAPISAMSYEWRKNGVPISVTEHPSAATASLTFEHLKASDAGQYDCVIAGSCGPVVTKLATLKICGGDMTCDGMVDDADFAPFATAYDLLLCDDRAMPAGCPSDFNGDGMVDDADFSLFAVAYNALLCE